MKKFLLVLIAIIANVSTSTSFGWGPRGHEMICLTAIQLVKNEKLHEFLIQHQFGIGYLCNVPDLVWRSLPPAETAVLNATHYFDSEIFLRDGAAQSKTNKLSQFSKDEMLNTLMKRPDAGSLPWRIEQFAERLEVAASWQEFMMNAAFLGHFAGDASQPLHGTEDYDGWQIGHGGIHVFYEDAVVNEFPIDVAGDILKAARKLQKSESSFLGKKSVFDRALELIRISLSEKDLLIRNDVILKPSVEKEERGMNLKEPAIREAPSRAVKKFQSMIVPELARSAVLLAQIWDETFSSNHVLPDDLPKKFTPLQLKPEAVMPNYFEKPVKTSEVLKVDPAGTEPSTKEKSH